MAGPLTADMVDQPATTLLRQLRSDGFEVRVDGDRLRVRPAERVTPALREALARRKTELLTLLAPVTEFVTLRNGPTLPLPALLLALDLERRGFMMVLDSDLQFTIAPTAALTELDNVAIARWRLHLGTIVGYDADWPESAH